MDPSYAAVYRELHEKHWWWRDRQHHVLTHLRRVCEGRARGNILDIGCGDGLLLEELEEFGRPEGVEPDAAIVSAKNRERWTVHLCPFDRAFDPGRKFALIVMLDVLEHLDDPQGALDHVHRLLEPAGLLIATVPASRLLWTNHDELNLHRTRYRRVELQDEIRGAGLELVECRHFFHWLAPIKLVIRLVEKLSGSKPRPPRLPHPVANQLFHLLTRLEQATWGRLALPFGTSILAIAKRPAASDDGVSPPRTQS